MYLYFACKILTLRIIILDCLTMEHSIKYTFYSTSSMSHHAHSYLYFQYMHLQFQFSPALIRLLPSKSDKWELLGFHFKIGTKLGEGNYGQVYKGTLSMEVATAPAKRYIARQTKSGKAPYTVAVKLLKGVQHMTIYFCLMKNVCWYIPLIQCPAPLIIRFE